MEMDRGCTRSEADGDGTEWTWAGLRQSEAHYGWNRHD